MDIVDRLVAYKDYTGLTNSQFADRAGIPRPTLSQFLNGRNKRISDDFTTKLHTAYPDLNVLWLLFGEGEMIKDTNNGFSEGKMGMDQPSLAFDFADSQNSTSTETTGHNIPDNQAIRVNPGEMPAPDSQMACEFEEAPYYGKYPPRQQSPAPTPYPRSGMHDFGSPNTGARQPAAEHDFGQHTTIPHVPTDPTKHIRSIVILYSDSSYEVFSPGTK